ncbi:MAG: hypothetical protein E6Q67_13010 [Roseateles sp.]|nr:MAG: hypothetical protein E6Q67_13010 [Roseateles sp.]
MWPISRAADLQVGLAHAAETAVELQRLGGALQAVADLAAHGGQASGGHMSDLLGTLASRIRQQSAELEVLLRTQLTSSRQAESSTPPT